MNEDEFWRKFLNLEAQVYIDTPEEYRTFCGYCHIKGFRWIDGSPALTEQSFIENGMYMMGTLEKGLPDVLIRDEKNEFFSKFIQTISVPLFLDTIAKESIDRLEAFCGYTVEFLFNHIIGHPIYQYDADTKKVTNYIATEGFIKNHGVVITTGIGEVEANELNQTWFLSASMAKMKGKEEEAGLATGTIMGDPVG